MAVNINKLSNAYKRHMAKYAKMVNAALRIMDTLPQKHAIRNIAAISFNAGYIAGKREHEEEVKQWTAQKLTSQQMTPMSGSTKWHPKE